MSSLATAKVRHLDGMYDVTWKQKGSQPIPLVIMDATVSPEWPAVIEEAANLWDASSAFQIGYLKVDPATLRNAIYPGEIRVVEELHDPYTLLEPNNQGFIDHAAIILPPYANYLSSYGDLTLWHLERSIRHELGHALTLDHHFQFVDDNPVCAMANGSQVTPFDLGLLCQRYSCR